MPARPKTTDEQILQATLLLIERNGRDGFTMSEVAASVGIRAPSLYKRFKDRADLLHAAENRLWAHLAELLGRAIVADDPTASVMAQAKAIRTFAKENPNSYSLFFDIRSPPTEAGRSARAIAVAQLLGPLSALVGGPQAFAAARVLVPFLHGFITMELANGFRLGDGVDANFETGVSVILRGIAD